MTHVAVIDIGKTNAKLALVDPDQGAEVAVLTRPNLVHPGPPWPHFDTDGIWAFVVDALATFQASHGVDAVSITTHGACAALLAADGSLAAPVLDYEHDGPDAMAAAYDAIRPPFAETGSPRLPMGLNIGAQLHWMLATDPGLLDRVAHVVTWPQYWGFRLTGQLACDVCSLGCHTDLWNPHLGAFSGLVDRLGLSGRFAPARRPDEVLGSVTDGVAARTGLRPGTPVSVGIHDSNASLLPHLHATQPPFSVVSTGTWVIVMAIGGAAVTLDPARDGLINVNALGQPVPSARFMGGREFDLTLGADAATPTADDLAAVLDRGVMLLPAVVPGTGPFPDAQARWMGTDGPTDPSTLPPAQKAAATSLYLALMTAECLTITGAAGPTLVEGPFARNAVFMAMLAVATGRAATPSASRTGTAIGAALLFGGKRPAGVSSQNPPTLDPALAAYAALWRKHTSG